MPQSKQAGSESQPCPLKKSSIVVFVRAADHENKPQPDQPLAKADVELVNGPGHQDGDKTQSAKTDKKLGKKAWTKLKEGPYKINVTLNDKELKDKYRTPEKDNPQKTLSLASKNDQSIYIYCPVNPLLVFKLLDDKDQPVVDEPYQVFEVENKGQDSEKRTQIRTGKLDDQGMGQEYLFPGDYEVHFPAYDWYDIDDQPATVTVIRHTPEDPESDEADFVYLDINLIDEDFHPHAGQKIEIRQLKDKGDKTYEENGSPATGAIDLDGYARVKAAKLKDGFTYYLSLPEHDHTELEKVAWDNHAKDENTKLQIAASAILAHHPRWGSETHSPAYATKKAATDKDKVRLFRRSADDLSLIYKLSGHDHIEEAVIEVFSLSDMKSPIWKKTLANPAATGVELWDGTTNTNFDLGDAHDDWDGGTKYATAKLSPFAVRLAITKKKDDADVIDKDLETWTAFDWPGYYQLRFMRGGKSRSKTNFKAEYLFKDGKDDPTDFKILCSYQGTTDSKGRALFDIPPHYLHKVDFIRVFFQNKDRSTVTDAKWLVTSQILPTNSFEGMLQRVYQMGHYINNLKGMPEFGPTDAEDGGTWDYKNPLILERLSKEAIVSDDLKLDAIDTKITDQMQHDLNRAFARLALSEKLGEKKITRFHVFNIQSLMKAYGR